MKTGLKSMTVILALTMVLAFNSSKATCYVAACGDYQVIGGQVVFVCGTNGNSHCLMPCPQQ